AELRGDAEADGKKPGHRRGALWIAIVILLLGGVGGGYLRYHATKSNSKWPFASLRPPASQEVAPESPPSAATDPVASTPPLVAVVTNTVPVSPPVASVVEASADAGPLADAGAGRPDAGAHRPARGGPGGPRRETFGEGRAAPPVPTGALKPEVLSET